MSKIDDLLKFEDQPVSQIIYSMVKWMGFDDVEMNAVGKAAVESGVWVLIRIKKGKKVWWIDGQRLDIVKRRLIEFLDKQKVRVKPEEKEGEE